MCFGPAEGCSCVFFHVEIKANSPPTLKLFHVFDFWELLFLFPHTLLGHICPKRNVILADT